MRVRIFFDVTMAILSHMVNACCYSNTNTLLARDELRDEEILDEIMPIFLLESPRARRDCMVEFLCMWVATSN